MGIARSVGWVSVASAGHNRRPGQWIVPGAARSGSTIKGVVTITLMVFNVIVWCTLLFTVALLKSIVPISAWRRVDEPWHDGPRRRLDRHQQRHLPR